MPNHVRNLLCIQSKDNELLDIVKATLLGENEFDFNKIKEMPEGFDGSQHCEWGRKNWGTKWNSYDHSNNARKEFASAMVLYFGFKKHKLAADQEKVKSLLVGTDGFDIALEIMKNVKMPDCFSIFNGSNLYYSFETAWNRPHKALVHLSNTFEDINITLAYADEDTGSNCGVMTYNKGVEHAEWYSNDQKEDYKKEIFTRFAVTVNGWNYDEYLEDMKEYAEEDN